MLDPGSKVVILQRRSAQSASVLRVLALETEQVAGRIARSQSGAGWGELGLRTWTAVLLKAKEVSNKRRFDVLKQSFVRHPSTASLRSWDPATLVEARGW